MSTMPMQFDPMNPTPQPGQAPRSYYDLMLSLSDLGAKERLQKQQMGLATELRRSPRPQLYDAGRIKVAASPLEHIASGVRTGLGAYGTIKGWGQQAQLADEIRRRIAEERAKQQGLMGPTSEPTPNQGMPIPLMRT